METTKACQYLMRQGFGETMSWRTRPIFPQYLVFFSMLIGVML